MNKLDLLHLVLNKMSSSIITEPLEMHMILLARGLLNLYAREDLPDWIVILANGNEEELESVRDVAVADIISEYDFDTASLLAASYELFKVMSKDGLKW